VKRPKERGDDGWDTTEVETVPTQAGYDRWAEVYDGEDNPLVLLEEMHIGPLAGKVAGLAVADIGCGTGRRWRARHRDGFLRRDAATCPRQTRRRNRYLYPS
jgi:hypothetical protein